MNTNYDELAERLVCQYSLLEGGMMKEEVESILPPSQNQFYPYRKAVFDKNELSDRCLAVYTQPCRECSIFDMEVGVGELFDDDEGTSFARLVFSAPMPAILRGKEGAGGALFVFSPSAIEMYRRCYGVGRDEVDWLADMAFFDECRPPHFCFGPHDKLVGMVQGDGVFLGRLIVGEICTFKFDTFVLSQVLVQPPLLVPAWLDDYHDVIDMLCDRVEGKKIQLSIRNHEGLEFGAILAKDIFKYVSRVEVLMRKDLPFSWRKLWYSLLENADIMARLEDRGRQKGVIFNRNLLANILALLSERGVLRHFSASEASKMLEGSRDHSVRAELSQPPHHAIDACITQAVDAVLAALGAEGQPSADTVI